MLLVDTFSWSGSLLGTILFLIELDTLTMGLVLFTELYILEFLAKVFLLECSTLLERLLLGTEFDSLVGTTLLLVGNDTTFLDGSTFSWSIRISLAVFITDLLLVTLLNWNLIVLGTNLLGTTFDTLLYSLVLGTIFLGSLLCTNLLASIRVTCFPCSFLGTGCLFKGMLDTFGGWLAVLVAFGILFEFQTLALSNNCILVANFLLSNGFVFQTFSSDEFVFGANSLTNFLLTRFVGVWLATVRVRSSDCNCCN